MKKQKGNTRTKQYSLFGRITKSVVLLVVGLFLVTGIVLGTVVSTSTHSMMIEELEEVSIAYTIVVEKELAILNEKVNAIAQYAQTLPGKLSNAKNNALLDDMKQEHGFISIYGIDKSGETSTPGISVNDREYFTVAMAGNFYTSSPFLKSDDTVGITVSVPVYKNGVIDGIVAVGVNYDYFSKFVDYNIGNTGIAYIIDKTGTMIAHTDSNYVLNFYNSINQVNDNPILESQAATMSRFISGDFESGQYVSTKGVKKTAVAKPIAGTDGWVLVTAMNNSEMNRTSVTVLAVLAVIVLLGVLVGIISAMKLAKRISIPINAINTRLTQLSNGDLSTEVAIVKSGDELQLLSEALYNTIMQLRMYIGEISGVTQSMASYKLNTQISSEFKGEFLPIKHSLNQIFQLMNQSFGEISESSQQVSVGAEQVSHAAQALSQGATQQASAVQELSATIAVISQQVKQNAGNATGISVKAKTVGNMIQQSNEQMQSLSVAMGEISVSSNEIGKIIKTIEDIAFQTNILALNAAVEAARAGAAGKGFAVVADEVRNLASKSAEAAKNTTELIEGSIKAVKNGTEIAQATAVHLQEVVVGATEIVRTIDQISGASSEQAVSIGEVTQGVEQIAAVIQTNSATAEESAAASEELSGQASMLKTLTDRFELSQQNQHEVNLYRPTNNFVKPSLDDVSVDQFFSNKY